MSNRLRTLLIRLFSSLLPFFLIIAVIGIRNRALLLQPEFWAEDATEFFRTAIERGPASLLMPVWGYHMLLGRIVAYLTTFFPVEWTPFLFSSATLALNACVCSYFSREGFSWLVESRNYRILACLVLATGTGTSEVFMNLANLPGTLTFLAILLLLEKPQGQNWGLSWKKTVLLLLLVASAGQMFVLAPLVLYLAWITRKKAYWLILLSFCPVLLLNALGGSEAAERAGLLNLSALPQIPQIILGQASIRFFVAPFVGTKATGYFMELKPVIFWMGSLAFTLTFALLWRRFGQDRRKLLLLGLAYACAISTFGIIALARAYAIDMIQPTSGKDLWFMRYAYLPGSVAVVIWFSVILSFKNSTDKLMSLRGRAFLHLPLAMLAVHGPATFDAVRVMPRTDWAAKAAEIQEIVDLRRESQLSEARTVQGIRVHPLGWNYEPMSLTIKPASIPK